MLSIFNKMGSPNLTTAGTGRPNGLCHIQLRLGDGWQATWDKRIFSLLSSVDSKSYGVAWICVSEFVDANPSSPCKVALTKNGG